MRPVVQTKIVCTKKSISTLKVIGGVKLGVCHSGVTLKMMLQLKLFKDKYLHNTQTLNSAEVCLQGARQSFWARAHSLDFPQLNPATQGSPDLSHEGQNPAGCSVLPDGSLLSPWQAWAGHV